MDRFEASIEIGLNLASKMLGIDIGWNYAIVDDNTSKEIVEKVFMAYDRNQNSVIINPNLKAILEKAFFNDYSYIRATLYSKLAHECRHGWQQKHPEAFKNDFKSTYGILGDAYIKNDYEADAYAFEEAFLKMMLDDIEAVLEFPFEAKEIHELAYQHYKNYAPLFVKYI